MKKILLSRDRSEYLLIAVEYPIRITKDEKAQLFCVHVITPNIPYASTAAPL
jgi:nucleotide-binding universal stress UspA family protein